MLHFVELGKYKVLKETKNLAHFTICSLFTGYTCTYSVFYLWTQAETHTCFFSAVYLSELEKCLPVSWAQFVAHVISKATLPLFYFFSFFFSFSFSFSFHFLSLFSFFFSLFLFLPAFLWNIEEQHHSMCLYHPGAPQLPSLDIYHGCSTGDWLCCFIALTAASLPCFLLGILSGKLPLIACCRHSFESWGFLFLWDFYFPSFSELPLLADSRRYVCAVSVFSVPLGVRWLMWRSFTAGSQ